MGKAKSNFTAEQTLNKKDLNYTLFRKLRKAYLQNEKAISGGKVSDEERTNKKFINLIEQILDNDPYGQHTKGKFDKESKENEVPKDDEVYLRFAEVVMWNMWSPLDENTRENIQAEVLGMTKMSNFAKVDDVKKFLTNNFGNLMREWAKIEKIDSKFLSYVENGDICKKCLEKNMLPVIAKGENDDYLDKDLKLRLKKASSLVNQIDVFEPNDNKKFLNEVRILLEGVHKTYYKFLINIPSYDNLFQDIFNNVIDTKFKNDDPFAETHRDISKFGTLWKLLHTSQEIIDQDDNYKNLQSIYPVGFGGESPYVDYPVTGKTDKGVLNFEFIKLQAITRILNTAHHSGNDPPDHRYRETQYETILKNNMIIFREDTIGFIEKFADLNLLPTTVVFYRIEKDVFGVHYKGNTLDGNAYVMLSQPDEQYELGKFYLVTSLTYPAFLVGYAVPF